MGDEISAKISINTHLSILKKARKEERKLCADKMCGAVNELSDGRRRDEWDAGYESALEDVMKAIRKALEVGDE
jgi:hypothetical protein